MKFNYKIKASALENGTTWNYTDKVVKTFVDEEMNVKEAREMLLKVIGGSMRHVTERPEKATVYEIFVEDLDNNSIELALMWDYTIARKDTQAQAQVQVYTIKAPANALRAEEEFDDFMLEA